MREFTDEEVFGAAPQAARELSDAEVFGAPPLDQQQTEYENQNPFFTRMGQRLSRGYNQAISSEHGANAADLAGALMELTSAPNTDQAHIDETRNALISSVANFAKNQGELAKIPVAPVAQAAGQAKDVGGYLDAVKTAPISYIADVGLPSLVQSAPAIGDFIMGGRVAGKRGGMAGGGMGSAGVDYAAELSGALTKAGVDVTNPEAIKSALMDPAFLDKAKKEAGLHAGVVGLFDALSFGLASKVMAPAKASPIAREITNLVAQAPAQGVLGAAGEAGGELAAGQELSPGEIGGEFFGEMFSAPADVAGAALAGTREKAPAQAAPVDIAGLLTKQDPDPMVVFPDGSTARKSEVDAMVKNMPIEERARMFNLGAEPAPAPEAPAPVTPLALPAPRMVSLRDGRVVSESDLANLPPEEQLRLQAGGVEPSAPVPLRAEDVVAQNAIPERSPIAEIIARNVGISRPEINTRARAKDVSIAANEKVGVTVDKETQQERPLTAAEYYRRHLGVPDQGVNEPKLGTTNQVSKTTKLVVEPKAVQNPIKVTEPTNGREFSLEGNAPRQEFVPTVNKAPVIDRGVNEESIEQKRARIPKDDLVGLARLVSDYKAARFDKNEALAKQLESKIDEKVVQFRLGRKDVYGDEKAFDRQLQGIQKYKNAKKKTSVAPADSLIGKEFEEAGGRFVVDGVDGDRVITRRIDEGTGKGKRGIWARGAVESLVQKNDTSTNREQPVNMNNLETPNGTQSTRNALPALRENDVAATKSESGRAGGDEGGNGQPAGDAAGENVTAKVDERSGEPGGQKEASAAEARQEKVDAAEKAKGPGTTFYGGPPIDKILEFMGVPEPIKGIKEFLADMKEAKAERTIAPQDARSGIRHLYDNVFATTHDIVLEAGDRYNSPLLKKLAEQLYAIAGRSDAERSYFEDKNREYARINDAIDILKDAKELGVSDQQLIAQVRSPKSRQGASGKLADRIEAWFKAELEYMNAAAGYTAITSRGPGYVPASWSERKISRNKEAFIQDAAGEYYKKLAKESDADAIEANLEAESRRRAEAFFERVVFGDEGRPGVDPKAGHEKFTKERTFEEDAYMAERLGKYLNDNLADIMFGYAHRSTKWAEVTRRWGENWSKWPEMERQMKKDGVPPEVVEEMRNLTDAIINGPQSNMSSWSRNFLSSLHAAQSEGLLEKSTFSSLAEVLMPIVRSNGDLRVAAHTLTTTLKDAVYEMFRASQHNKSLTDLFDDAERLGVIASAEMNQLAFDQYANLGKTGKFVGKSLDRFFTQIGIVQLTNRNIARGGIGGGSVFLDSLAKQTLKGRNDSKLYLQELGVPKGKEAEFSQYVRDLRGKRPNLPEYGTGTEMEEIYRTAILRFVDQTVMRPNRATRAGWQNHPIGRVVGAIQSFNQAFHKNVLTRAARNAKTAVTAEELDAFERLRMAGGMLPGLVLMSISMGMIWGIRDALFSDRKKTPGAKIETALSATGLTGKFDPLIQMYSGVRYGRGVAQSGLGPVVGNLAEASQSLATYILNNSDKTNNAERKLIQSLYSNVAEPALQAGAGYIFLKPGILAFGMRALAIPAGRNASADALAGEKKQKEQKPIRGVVESLFEDNPKTTSGHGSSRSSSRSSGRASRQAGR